MEDIMDELSFTFILSKDTNFTNDKAPRSADGHCIKWRIQCTPLRKPQTAIIQKTTHKMIKNYPSFDTILNQYKKNVLYVKKCNTYICTKKLQR